MTASSCDRSAAVSRRGTCATCRRWFAASPGISTPARPERHGLVTLLFEIDHDLVAVAAFQRYSEHTGEIVPIALATAHQGARLRPDGRPLAVAVLDETLRQMADAGYRRAAAWVAKEHDKSQRLLRRAGFSLDETADPTYDLAAAPLAATDHERPT